MTALQKLRKRTGELADLESVQMLLSWDQLVMMPPEGGRARSEQLGTLARLNHERARDEQLGEWLTEVEGAELGELERDIVRLARRDWERARRVPEELAAELARAAAEGQQRWQVAREADDFAMFAPALERNVELAREYGVRVAGEGLTPYEGLLGDFDFGLRADELRRMFGALAEALPPLVGEAERCSPQRTLDVPVAAQQGTVAGVLGRLGVDRSSWRVDVSAHPFTAWIGRGDTRLTTRYSDGNVESLLSSLHEYGHALYERQIDPALVRTNLGRGTSMSVHESQSKVWENHVARSAPFAELLAGELAAAGFSIAAEELHATMVGVKRSLIRVTADALTYPLHIILRFELELALIEGGLAVADLPGAWSEGVRRLLGLEVPSDALGSLQDVHWGAGTFGYFPSYALGCLIAAQLWEALERELGPRDEDLRRGEVDAIKTWLGERVHRHGRRLDTTELVESATGAPLSIDPFMRYVEPLAQSRP
ncbi:MAG TPA: carboxypeptidase M32 [Solirubrobacteraceae bacterium]|nr:carboxypeptidase M32 [Solirubrobacteraceae bacterium]